MHFISFNRIILDDPYAFTFSVNIGDIPGSRKEYTTSLRLKSGETFLLSFKKGDYNNINVSGGVQGNPIKMSIVSTGCANVTTLQLNRTHGGRHSELFTQESYNNFLTRLESAFNHGLRDNSKPDTMRLINKYPVLLQLVM